MYIESFIKNLYSIFFRWLQILAIVPKPGVSKNAYFYTKVYGFIILHTLLLIHSNGYRMNVISRYYQLPLSMKHNIGFMEDLSEVIIYSTYLVVMWSYCKNNRWQKYYENLNGFSYETTDGKSSLVIFGIFIITNVAVLSKVFLATKELYERYGDLHLAATLVIYPMLQYYYVFCYSDLMLLTLLKVTWQVRKAIWTLNQKHTNLKNARAEFFKALTMAQFFNDVFGHPLLFMFGMWVFQIIGLLLKFVMLIKPNSKNDMFEADLRPMWKTVVDLSGKVIFSSVSNNKKSIHTFRSIIFRWLLAL